MSFGILKEFLGIYNWKRNQKMDKKHRNNAGLAFGPTLWPAGLDQHHKPSWLAWQKGRDVVCSRVGHRAWGTRSGVTTGVEWSDQVECGMASEHCRGERFL
jgi:hypothetical protein